MARQARPRGLPHRRLERVTVLAWRCDAFGADMGGSHGARMVLSHCHGEPTPTSLAAQQYHVAMPCAGT